MIYYSIRKDRLSGKRVCLLVYTSYRRKRIKESVSTTYSAKKRDERKNTRKGVQKESQ